MGTEAGGGISNHVELSFAGFLMDMRVSNFCLSLPEAMYILYTYIICIYVYIYIYTYIQYTYIYIQDTGMDEHLRVYMYTLLPRTHPYPAFGGSH